VSRLGKKSFVVAVLFVYKHPRRIHSSVVVDHLLLNLFSDFIPTRMFELVVYVKSRRMLLSISLERRLRVESTIHDWDQVPQMQHHV
jgi:hypothetical protein